MLMGIQLVNRFTARAFDGDCAAEYALRQLFIAVFATILHFCSSHITGMLESARL